MIATAFQRTSLGTVDKSAKTAVHVTGHLLSIDQTTFAVRALHCYSNVAVQRISRNSIKPTAKCHDRKVGVGDSKLSEIQVMQISAIQTSVQFADASNNLKLMSEIVMREAGHGSRLVIFPECFTTGYCFDSKEEALAVAEEMRGPTVQAVCDLAQQAQCGIIFGMLEQRGDQLFNVAVLVGPDGIIGSYRKVHLPFLGVDRFTTHGDRPFEVFEFEGVKIGLLICYDGGFPEASRELALAGADLIALPTNWPRGAEYMSAFSVNSRAMENGVYFAAVNRIGTENGFGFIGQSRIAGPYGETLVHADHANEEILRTEISIEKARQKEITRVPGKHIIDRFADRRPEMYGRITEAHQLPFPGRPQTE
ncbi:MAG: carbon-nitrogen hydrolase family protein [Fuerstiella sp.]